MLSPRIITRALWRHGSFPGPAQREMRLEHILCHELQKRLEIEGGVSVQPRGFGWAPIGRIRDILSHSISGDGPGLNPLLEMSTWRPVLM